MLRIDQIYKSYEGHPLLKGVSFEVASGETLCLLGPSGGGKSTLLRIIAGLESAENGQIFWQGTEISRLPPHRRHFGLMFQDYALFPHRNVAENVAFGLRMLGLARPEINARTNQALEQVNMLPFARRSVGDLSGGEQQRVALARALAPRPHLLMLDEPLSALDHSLRDQLLDELRRLLHTTQIPAIYVTHDQEEAFALADRIILLNNGQIEQAGEPQAVYANPATPWAARFLGLDNLLEGKVVSTAPLHVQTVLGTFEATCSGAPVIGQQATLLLRAHAAQRIEITPGSSPANLLHGIVEDAQFQRFGYRTLIRCQSHAFHFMLPASILPGEAVALALAPDAVQCLPES